MTEVSSPPEYASTTRFTLFAMTMSLLDRGARSGAVEEMDDDALLSVQPILRLVEDHAPRPVQHRIRDLLAPVGGQAVHDERPGGREAQQRLVELVALEGLEPLLAVAPPGPC